MVFVTGGRAFELGAGAGQARADGADWDAERGCRVGVGELTPQDEEDDVLFRSGERRDRSEGTGECVLCPEALNRVVFGA